MPNTYFQFKQFRVNQEKSGMKVTTDACLFGGWIAKEIEKRNPSNALDIGTGTGLLSLMLAQKTCDTQIDALELNEIAFQEADDNFKKSEWSNKLNAYYSSVQEYTSLENYDLIISNPPFFHNSHKGADESKNQALHSSHLSMEDLLESVLSLLSDKGSFYLLYPELEMNRFILPAEKSGLFLAQLVTVRNKTGGSVFRKMAMFQLKKTEVENSEIVIKRADGMYTEEFWELLKDYYLEYNDPKLSD